MWALIAKVLPMVLSMMSQGKSGTAETSMGTVNTAPANYYKTQGSAGGSGWGSTIMNVLGNLGGGQQGQIRQTGQSSIIGGQQAPTQAPQQLFQYEPRNISAALANMLKQARGF